MPRCGFSFGQCWAAGILHVLILACCLTVLLPTALRQAIVVSLLDRLHTAETAIRHNEEKLYRVAHFAPLTELPNHRYFEDALDQTVQLAAWQDPPDRCVAVLLLDLDHFNNGNENFGHCLGDMLLQEASRRIAQHLLGAGFWRGWVRMSSWCCWRVRTRATRLRGWLHRWWVSSRSPGS